MSTKSKTYKNSPKKVYIRTFGCQMNDRDSEALAGLLLEKGYSYTENKDEADIVLINTCSVRQHAEERALSFAGSFKNRKKIVGVIGCMARARGKEIYKKMSQVKIICSPAKMPYLAEFIEKAALGKRVIDIEDGVRPEEFYHASFRLDKAQAQVVISTGCSNYCSYCIVPYVRGPLRLRKPEDIIAEVKKNIDLGIRKIVLLGQNVNDYRYEGVDFTALLEKVEKLDLEEITFITCHPKNTPSELFYLMKESKKIKKYLHLPFQSGSNRILKLMNRGYTIEEYLEKVSSYRKITKGVLAADVIVGFPTESEQDFLMTKKVLEEVKFDFAYIFKYSPRPYSAAFQIEDDVPLKEKQNRHKILLDLQKRISLNIKKAG